MMPPDNCPECGAHFEKPHEEGCANPAAKTWKRKPDPRNNADDAYAAFMSMGEDEWSGLLRSLMGGGVLQPEEDKGFKRALAERRSTGPDKAMSETLKDAPPPMPDYGEDAAPETAAETHARLQGLVLKMAQLELEEGDLTTKLESVQQELRRYRENLVPELMSELGVEVIRTRGGIHVEMKEELRAAMPKDSPRQARAFAWLKETGNDGMIKREITVQYGRDSTEWAEQFLLQLEELKVGEHATIQQEWTVNHQTLLAFLRGELREGRNVPMEVFSAFVQKYAKIKRGR